MSVARQGEIVIAPLLRLTMMGTTIAVLLIGALRLLPTSLPDLRDIERLFPVTEECPAGCMLGIPPEVTRLNDAVRMLEAHEWVGGVYGDWRNQVFQAEVTVRWRWSGAQPDFIDASVPGVMLARTYSGAGGHVVLAFTLPTRFRLYNLQQTFGPASDGLALYDSSQDTIRYTVSYHDPDTLTRTSLMASLPCPVSLLTYWHAYAAVDYRRGHMLSAYVPPQSLGGVCR